MLGDKLRACGATSLLKEHASKTVQDCQSDQGMEHYHWPLPVPALHFAGASSRRQHCDACVFASIHGLLACLPAALLC
jgi:hypothetical protein